MFCQRFVSGVLLALSFVSTAAFAQSLAKQVDVPGIPIGIAVNTLNNRIYVSQNNIDESNAATFVSIIDGATNTVLKTIGGPGDLVGNVAVDVVTGHVFIVGCRSLQVAEVTCLIGVYDADLNGLTSITDAEVGSPLAVNPITHRLYYARQSVDGLAVLDTRTNTFLGRIRLGGSSPGALDIDLAANQVFALFGIDNVNVAQIDAHASKVLLTKNLGTVDNADIAVDPFRHHLYVTNFNRNGTSRSTVTVLDSRTLALQKKVLVGVSPAREAIDTFTGEVFVTNSRFRTLYVINGETLTAHKSLTGPLGGVAVNPNTKTVYTGTATIFIEPITGKVDVVKE